MSGTSRSLKAVLVLSLAVMFSMSVVAEGFGEQGNAQAGLKHGVTADVTRANHTYIESLSLYCRWYSIDSCDNKVHGFNPMVWMNAAYNYHFVDWEKKYNESVNSVEKGSDSEVQKFGDSDSSEGGTVQTFG